MPNEIHQIGGVFAIMNRESVAEANVECVFAKKPRADGMKRSRPVERISHRSGLRAEHLCRDALDSALHFAGGAAREGEQHHATRVRPRDDEKRRCSIKRAAAMFHSAALFGVELGKIGSGHRRSATSRKGRPYLFKGLSSRLISRVAPTRQP